MVARFFSSMKCTQTESLEQAKSKQTTDFYRQVSSVRINVSLQRRNVSRSTIAIVKIDYIIHPKHTFKRLKKKIKLKGENPGAKWFQLVNVTKPSTAEK